MPDHIQLVNINKFYQLLIERKKCFKFKPEFIKDIMNFENTRNENNIDIIGYIRMSYIYYLVTTKQVENMEISKEVLS